MKRKPDLSKDIDLLLDDLCREWGFCNRLTAADLLAHEAPLSANEFARAVLQAEGMNSELETSWMRRIKERFVDRYGASVSPESYARTISGTD
ncbi:hypothetical protein [Bradyrhizobium paxllaeri]|uniref:hypothetical protein n=1 Tax=Bradyrhizobium paxllaeri TaxID=190148 RepID=UPI0011477AA3|nr:hypothetical protein [Bradyrhizobium paxllaeri]